MTTVRTPGSSGMTRPVLSPLDVADCVAKDMTVYEAADALGYHVETVRACAADMGMRFRDPRTPDAETLARIVADRNAGETYAAIGRRYGMTTSGARKLLLRALADEAPHSGHPAA